MKCKECNEKLNSKNRKYCSQKCYNKELARRAKSETHRRLVSKKMKERINKFGHPKGMLGKKHTVNTRKKISMAHKGKKRNWKGGKQTYWNKKARQIANKKLNTDICSLCGKKANQTDYKILIHHKDQDITNNNTKNLMPVCELCHANKCHPNRIRKMRKGYKRYLEKIKK